MKIDDSDPRRAAFESLSTKQARNVLLGAVVATLVCSCHSQARAAGPVGEVEFVLSSPPSPVGAGARAVGFGSAFIGIADDATAASWNPAGLSQLERPEVSLVGRFGLGVDEVGSLSDFSEASGSRSIDAGTDAATALDVNYLSAAVPFSWGERNVVVSMNFQQLFSFARDLTYVAEPSGDEIRYRQYGALYALSPAVSLELAPDLSFGGALNVLVDDPMQSFAWRSRFTRRTHSSAGEPFIASDHPTFGEFHGVNATFGMLWKPASAVSVGSVVKLPFQSSFLFTNHLTAPGATGSRREHLSMRFPLEYGAGVAVHPADFWTVSLDVTRVEWDQFRVTDAAGNEFLVSGELAATGNVPGITTVRAGTEWVAVLDGVRWSLRAGGFYDPEPASRNSPDFYGAALGTGVTFSDFSVDVAYQLRFGLGVDQVSTVRSVLDIPAAKLDVFQHAVYLSTVYYF